MPPESRRAGSGDPAGETPDGGARDADSRLDRKRLGVSLGVGSVAVVAYELVGLVSALDSSAGGVERGATLTILLMIVVTFLTVGGIGYGLYRAVRGRAREPEPRRNP